jgi:DNA-binding beta-propeller fold protein YncE
VVGGLATCVAFCLLGASATPADAALKYARAWPVSGRDIPLPDGVAVDPVRAVVYASDYEGGVVRRFTTRGRLLGSFGRPGVRRGQLDGPTALAVDPVTGHVFVVETGVNSSFGSTDRVSEFAPSGRFVRSFGGSGSAPGKLDGPESVAIDPAAGLVYVTDQFNDRVEVFNRRGRFLRIFGGRRNVLDVPSDIAVDPATGTLELSMGSGSGRYTPAGVRLSRLPDDLGPLAFDPITGDVLEVDNSQDSAGSNAIHRYSARGQLLAQTSRPGSNGHVFVNGNDVLATDELTSVAADCGDVFATDDAGERIEAFHDPRTGSCHTLALADTRGRLGGNGVGIRVLCLGPRQSPRCRGRLKLTLHGQPVGSAGYSVPDGSIAELQVAVGSAFAKRRSRLHAVAMELGVTHPVVNRDVLLG